jgi:hypothetical protein
LSITKWGMDFSAFVGLLRMSLWVVVESCYPFNPTFPQMMLSPFYLEVAACWWRISENQVLRVVVQYDYNINSTFPWTLLSPYNDTVRLKINKFNQFHFHFRILFCFVCPHPFIKITQNILASLITLATRLPCDCQKEQQDRSSSNKDYDYPYLCLLQTLWPGKFKQIQLWVIHQGNIALLVV